MDFLLAIVWPCKQLRFCEVPSREALPVKNTFYRSVCFSMFVCKDTDTYVMAFRYYII